MDGTTERYAPLPSPGRGRWREAPDEGPFCEAKRWGLGPIQRTPAIIAPHQSASLTASPKGSQTAAAGTRDERRELRIAAASLRTGLAMTGIVTLLRFIEGNSKQVLSLRGAACGDAAIRNSRPLGSGMVKDGSRSIDKLRGRSVHVDRPRSVFPYACSNTSSQKRLNSSMLFTATNQTTSRSMLPYSWAT